MKPKCLTFAIKCLILWTLDNLTDLLAEVFWYWRVNVGIKESQWLWFVSKRYPCDSATHGEGKHGHGYHGSRMTLSYIKYSIVVGAWYLHQIFGIANAWVNTGYPSCNTEFKHIRTKSLAELSSVFIIKHGKINGCCSGLIILKCISFCQEEYWRRNIYFHLICRWSEPSISNRCFYPNISVHYRHNLKCFVFVSFTYKNILSSLTIYYCSTNFVKKWMPPLWDLAKSGHSSGDLEI